MEIRPSPAQAVIPTAPRALVLDPTSITPAALRVRPAARYVGLGVSTLWKKSAEDPTFPQPRRLSARVTVWLKADLDAWLARAEG
jgi:predicted DNA-binding transcriptional regulator AlpA